VLVPSARLNASFATRMPRAGDLAVISQSGAIVAGMIEWAAQRAIGFSAVFSVGDQIDVDFGDLLDFFAVDRTTRAIVLYVEAIKDSRKFMSAGLRCGPQLRRSLRARGPPDPTPASPA
jgi:acetyltransferase